MKQIPQHETDYYISEQVKKQLTNSKKAVIDGDQDRVFIITGYEGSGKSKLARQLAYFLDKTFSEENIVFKAKDFKEQVRKLPKFKAIVFDEAFRGLSSRGALSKANKELVRLLQECRQRNLFIFIVLPSIFLLEKYVALFRSHALFHTSIYKKDYKKRYYKVYNRPNKHLLYLLGQKMMSYSRPNIFEMHRFYGKEPSTIDLDKYEEMKLKSFLEDEEDEQEDHPWLLQRTILSHILQTKYKMTQVEQGKVITSYGIPLNGNALSKIRRKYAKKLEKGLSLVE